MKKGNLETRNYGNSEQLLIQMMRVILMLNPFSIK